MELQAELAKVLLLHDLLLLVLNRLNPALVALELRCYDLFPVLSGIILMQIHDLQAETIPVHPAEDVIGGTLRQLEVGFRLLQLSLLFGGGRHKNG